MCSKSSKDLKKYCVTKLSNECKIQVTLIMYKIEKIQLADSIELVIMSRHLAFKLELACKEKCEESNSDITQ